MKYIKYLIFVLYNVYSEYIYVSQNEDNDNKLIDDIQNNNSTEEREIFQVSTKKSEKINVIICDSSYCSITGGDCIKLSYNTSDEKEEECICKQGFKTIEDDYFYKCSYRQKSYRMAFFLEFVVGFGAGHFYIGNKTIGYTKLIIYLVLFISLISLTLYKSKISAIERENSFCFRFIKSLCFLSFGLIYFTWQLIDAVLFCLGEYKDNNEIELYH